MIDYDQEFLKRWEPEVIEPKAESKYDAPKPSSLCRECRKLGEDLVCEVRGFDMRLAPAVYACVESTFKKKPVEETAPVEITRTFTVEVTQILPVGKEASAAAEERMRAESAKDMERKIKAALGADDAKVKDLKIFLRDKE